MKIRAVEEKDVEEVSRLMEEMIDEVYASESAEVKKILRANYTGSALKELFKDKQAVFYVVDSGNKIAALLLGWLFCNVLTIHWIYVSKEHRGKGAAKQLFDFVEKKLIESGCYKMVTYAWAKNNAFIDFALKFGFKKGVLVQKSMFGIPIQAMHKIIGDCNKSEKEIRIKIVGEAGQGIKLLSYTLSSILAQFGNEVSLNMDYDAAVRSGTIIADLTYSEDRIENPIIEEADVLIKFTRTRKWFPSKQLIIDENICGKKCISCSINCKRGEQFKFTEEALSKFGSKVFINMIALGRILRHIGINILLIDISDLLPPKFMDKNIEAIKYGANFRDSI